MAKTKLEIVEMIDVAREAGCSSIKIDGVEYNIAKKQGTSSVKDPGLTAKDLMDQMPLIDNELTDEEILFWSCDYGKELEAEKLKKAKVQNG